MVMDINLNTKNLHKDLEAVRRSRSHIDGEAEIRLMWMDDSGVHTVRVIANGPKLWVTGYYDQNGSRVPFAAGEDQRILNYAASDTGCRLFLPDIIGVLGALEQIPAPADFTAGGQNARARNAYVMCVFLVSEMVRNELLEKVLLMETKRPGSNARMWRDYILLYKNWAKASKALYKVESGKDYPTIYAADVKSMFVRLETGELAEAEIRLYRQLIEELCID